jgi:hypothetical protein
MEAFLTPTLLISGIAFFTLLFGKIIADERAFADDRNWHIQFSGFLFVLMFIPIQSLVGYVAAHFIYIWLGDSIVIQILNVILALAELCILIIVADWLMRRRYPFMGASHASKFIAVFESEMKKDPEFGLQQKLLALFQKTKEQFLKREPSKIGFVTSSTAYFAYAISFDWISHSNLMIVVTGTIGLLGLVLAAYIRSMQMAKTVRVNIYFTDSRKPLKDVVLLRVNSDNVKIEGTAGAVLLNKNLVSKIEEVRSI